MLTDTFLDHQEHYKGVSRERVVRQRRVLADFASTLDGRLVEEGTADDLYAYMAAKVSEGVHPNTIRQYRNLIRPFFTWAWERGDVDADCLLRIRHVQCPQGATGKSKPNPYSRTELQQFWADLERAFPLDPVRIERWTAGRIKRTRLIRRHAMRLQIEAVVALALEMGLRRHEIFDRTLDELHYDNEYIVVTGKGDKRREVPFTPTAREAMRQWIELRTLLAPGHDFPWLSLAREDCFTRPMRWRRFQGLLSTVGPYTLHRFRHTCATERLRAGMPLETVQDLLGHATLEQTRAYAEIARHDLSRAVERSNGAFSAAVRPKLRAVA